MKSKRKKSPASFSQSPKSSKFRIAILAVAALSVGVIAFILTPKDSFETVITDAAAVEPKEADSARAESQIKAPTGIPEILSVKGEVRSKPSKKLIQHEDLGEVVEIRYPDGTILYEPADEEVVMDSGTAAP